MDFYNLLHLESIQQGFPGGSVVKSQRRGCRFNPWSGKIPHASKQLSLCATTTEPAFWSPRATSAGVQVPWSLCSTGSYRDEKPVHHNREEPPLRVAQNTITEQLTTVRESLCAARRPSAAISKINLKKKKKKNSVNGSFYFQLTSGLKEKETV